MYGYAEKIVMISRMNLIVLNILQFQADWLYFSDEIQPVRVLWLKACELSDVFEK